MYSDYQNTENEPYPPYRRPRNGMATASLIFGILALFSGAFLFLAIPAGALAILCALLSRTEKRLPGKSLIGLAAGLTAAISSCVLTVQSFRYIMENPAVRAYYSQFLGELLEEYDLPQEYNIFDDGSRRTLPKQPAPAPSTPNTPRSDDEINDLYDDLFRYFYGQDPYLTPEPAPAPSTPDNAASGGVFI